MFLYQTVGRMDLPFNEMENCIVVPRTCQIGETLKSLEVREEIKMEM